MKRHLVYGILLILMVSAFSLGCAQKDASSGESQEIVVQGSTTVLPLAQREAEAYMAEHPDASITVIGGGSGVGIKALIDGQCDIADASRAMKPSEIQRAEAKGVEPVEHVIAYDGIAVVVHPDNPVDQLTYDQIKGIYTGEISNWKEVGGEDKEIAVLGRDSSSGTYEYFQEEVLDGEEYRADMISQPSNGAVLQEAKQNKGAIGYIGMAYLDPGVKALNVSKDGTTYAEPTIETVKSGEYAIARPLYQYTDGQPTGLAKDFIDFELSEDGQALVKEVGYVPVQ